MIESATAFAPASASNLAVGFDTLGHPLSGVGDRVKATRSAAPGVRVSFSGAADLPIDPERNSASAGVLAMLRDLRADTGLELRVGKGIPLGSGIGGSAASAVAGVVAANAVLGRPFEGRALLDYALVGESAASGARHADNVAPALFGGLVLVRSTAELDIVPLPAPAELFCAVALPELSIETREARAVLPRQVALGDAVVQSANLAGVIAGLFRGDLGLIGRSLRDVLIEPHRAPLVRGFHRVQDAALREGALGCSLSGAGPALFAWCAGEECAAVVAGAMRKAFNSEGVAARAWTSPVGGRGARIEAAA